MNGYETLRRSILSVPATDVPTMRRAMSSGADTLFFDLEDSVPESGKDEARRNVVEVAKHKPDGALLGVRVNAWSTRWCYRDIIDTVTEAGEYVDYIVLAKAETPTEVAAVAGLLSQVERNVGVGNQVLIEPSLESGAALLEARGIMTASRRVFSAMFAPNGIDFAADMHFLDGLRQEYVNATSISVIAAARASRLPLVDGPYTALYDLPGLKRVASERFRMGFDGMWAIHPGQIDTINESYTPTDEMVAKAAATVEACERAAARGRGAAVLDDAMVDIASIRLSQVILERSAQLVDPVARRLGGVREHLTAPPASHG